MHSKVILSIDAMGGANAPQCVLQAIAQTCKQRSDIKFLLFGVESDIRRELNKFPETKPYVEIRESNSVISDAEQPVKAMRNSAGSSMRMALEAVKNKEAHACVSGGNTGALMVIAKLCLGMLAGIKRPAIVSIFPNRKHGSVMLDLGANSECDAQHLLQFAMMGVSFAKVVLRRENPSVGILNVGVEEYKGRELDKKVAELLKESELNYYGFVEGHDLCDGAADVVVTDGFTGNIALKIAEGVAKTSIEYMKRGLTSDLISRIGAFLAARGLRRSLAMLDPRHYNGAMLMGLDGIVVKSHGSSDHVGFANALKVAISLVEDGINRDIMLMMQQHSPISELGSSIVSKIKQSFGF
jgi:glycerol-3-phosphate acyltransferase PlsX